MKTTFALILSLVTSTTLVGQGLLNEALESAELPTLQTVRTIDNLRPANSETEDTPVKGAIRTFFLKYL